MQSLILATTLVLTTPVTIDSVDNEAQLDTLIKNQTQHVNELVIGEVKNVIQDSYFAQAKLALNASAEYVATLPTTNDNGAE